ncbi:MAG: AmmeMemoRadiSam system radical SAM enzyme [Candidatus Micrarchaeia archaeon]|jgi:pyruvate formate lyase activating enzyme
MGKELYIKLENEIIQCIACNRKCKIPAGKTGFCKVRENKNGKLNLLVYEKPCAVWIDPIEKKPLFHFLPGTQSYSIGTYGCNFNCKFCQNWSISQAPKEFEKDFGKMLAKLQILCPQKAVEEAIRGGCKSISYTYTEPTIFSEYAKDIGILARKKGLKNVYVTNGYQTKECWNYLSDFVDGANIDIKGNEKFYKELCGNVKLRYVLDSVKYAKKLGIWVEVTTLLIPNENDSDEFIERIAKFLYSVDPKTPWHITAFHPDYKMTGGNPTSIQSLINARKIAKEIGLENIYCGNMLNEHENTICPECRKTIIERIGFRIVNNNIINGRCIYCKSKIVGVFE